jgi:putative DNA primase/helicase
MITAECKYRESFDFVPFARLIFSTNHLPQSKDDSLGCFDRWLVIPFAKRFRGTEEEIPRAHLDT